MKKLKIFFICLFFCAGLIGQDSDIPSWKPLSNDKIFLELGGQCYYYSLNYERNIETNFKWFPSWRVGAAYDYSLVTTFGLDLNKRIGLNHQASFGFSTTFVWNYFAGTGSVFHDLLFNSDKGGFLKLGYQYSKRESNWFFGGAFTPVIYDFGLGGGFIFYPWGGLQVGYYL